nr:reverse transcriptase domain-containing protein [Tanacetum cinerariifolium]
MADTRTMSELLQAPTEGYRDAIVLSPILVEKFELKTTNLKNNITNFQQRFDESFGEAWDHFKDLLRKCLHHGFLELHQIDTFNNALTQSDQDSLNAAASGNLLNRTPRDALTIIKNKSKVYVTALTEIVKELVLMNNTTQQASVKAIKETCVTCGGPHPYYECLATSGNTFDACAPVETYNQGGLGSLPSNTIAKPRGDLKAINTRSGVAYEGPSILPTSSSLPKEVERAPKFASTFKILLSNKEELFELASTPLNENCSAVLHKKLPEKLRDTSKFLVPCDFLELEECLVLADLGASINLMPLFVWKKLLLLELTPTRITLELANQSVAYPFGVAEDFLFKVGKFYFLADFVVVDYDVDPWVPLILRRPFLRTVRVLIDVYSEELTLRFNDEAIMFKVGHTSRYSRNYYKESVNQINIIDITCKEYDQEVLRFLDSSTSGNPTPSDPIIASSSPSFTPFKGGDFILEEIKTFLCAPDEISNLDDDYYDTEGDILYLEKLLNEGPSPNLHSMKNEELKQFDIPIDPQDQEKTTFTCPYGAFAYRRMPFGLCNALGTFQRCMMAIFHDMIKETMEVFMDDFSVFEDSLSSCLSHLDKMLKWCEETNLVLNWEVPF